MATMKCKACNRVYDYRSSELCPKCGAYNRPPHPMEVAFNGEGDVVLRTDKDAPCYTVREEENPCPVKEQKPWDVLVKNDIVDQSTLDALGNQLNKWGSRMEKFVSELSEGHTAAPVDRRKRNRARSSKNKGAIIAAVVAVMAGIFGQLLESCNYSDNRYVGPENSVAVEEVAPSARDWSEEDKKEMLTHYGVTEVVDMGTTFDWQGRDVLVGGWEISESYMFLSLESHEDLPPEMIANCFLVWGEDPQCSWTYNSAGYQDGALIFDGIEPLVDGTKVWLLCQSYDANGNHLGTTAVTLN